METVFRRRMARVIRHIHRHLDGDLRLETLASVAAFSPFHFHRQFAAYAGMIRRFIGWRRENRLPPSISATFNIFHDDPDSVAPADYRLDICAAITGKLAPNNVGVVEGIIPGGPCAVIRQLGSGDDLRAAAQFLYRQWLPASGREARGFPLFAQRLRFFPDVPEDQAVTDLFLPLRAAA